MKKTLTLVSAAALSAAFAVSASAQQLPLNNTVAGSQGAAQVSGQGGGVLIETTTLIAGVTVTVFVAALSDDGTPATTTPGS